MKFGVITIFPDFFRDSLRTGILGRAMEKGLIETAVWDLRDFTRDRHRTVDDASFGGGAGMVLKPEPLAAAIREARSSLPGTLVLALSPGGERLTDSVARRLGGLPSLVLVCGRYEGIDQRVIDHCCDGELSLGDFVLTGGEPAALVVIDAVARQVPGVVGKQENVETESFRGGLKHPVYTRPAVFEGHAAPEALVSGNQRLIDEWRRGAALGRTVRDRPGMALEAGRHRIALEFSGFDADAAGRVAERFLGVRAAKAIFISDSAAQRKMFRDRFKEGALATSPREAGRKIGKALGDFERLAFEGEMEEMRAKIACSLAKNRSVVISLPRKEDRDWAADYFTEALARLFSG